MEATEGTIRVRLFARYAELLGRDTLTLTVTLPTTVADVVAQLRRTLPAAQALPERPLTAVNLRHVFPESPLSDGDELALLPPLAGG
ncbi:MAG TPA: MoaD/ThiS family protein [Gemmatimonadales bacterium]|nr:MoaD/ThiS family protein [Gemmatimonadales bacterium]